MGTASLMALVSHVSENYPVNVWIAGFNPLRINAVDYLLPPPPHSRDTAGDRENKS